MLDFVPFAGAGREMTDLDVKAGAVGQPLALGLPEPDAVGVRAAAVGSDRQSRGGRVSLCAQVLPPAEDRVDRELGGV